MSSLNCKNFSLVATHTYCDPDTVSESQLSPATVSSLYLLGLLVRFLTLKTTHVSCLQSISLQTKTFRRLSLNQPTASALKTLGEETSSVTNACDRGCERAITLSTVIQPHDAVLHTDIWIIFQKDIKFNILLFTAQFSLLLARALP
jgi:hypothetical protein